MLHKFVEGHHFLFEEPSVFVLAWDRHTRVGDVAEQSFKAKLVPLSWMMSALHVLQYSEFGWAPLATHDAMEERRLTILRADGKD